MVLLPCKDFAGVTTASDLSHVSIQTSMFMMAVKEEVLFMLKLET